MILLGVTGSIAAYKAADICRLFLKSGQDVHVAMTPSAVRFVGPLTFEALTGHPVLTDTLDPKGWQMAHLALSSQAGAVVVAPATAECMSELARGGAANILSASMLAVPRSPQGKLKIPVFIAPAMHENMWLHPATQNNLRILKSFGCRFIGPEKGPLGRAGDEGVGRMSEPSAIVETVLKSIHS
jgi:phosphopantothenoylcysteine decarboxylase/phosphopantothenate--cysteine ligase